MKVVSAGGVIMHGEQTLLLRTFYGGWVLPKGQVEEGETLQETALREVQEESGLTCRVIKYIGFIRYNFQGRQSEVVQKKVHFYAMEWIDGKPAPQLEEGFRASIFVPWKKAVAMLSHDSERTILRSAFENRPKQPRSAQ